MANLLNTRGPLVLTLTIFCMGVCTLALVATTSPQRVTNADKDLGYGLITVANAANR